MISQKDALIALLDGRTVRASEHSYRLEGDDLVFHYKDMTPWKKLSFLSNVTEITDSFPLTFQEAYKAMKDGKRVVRESSPSMYYYITEHLPGADMERIYFRPVDGSEPGRLAYINVSALDDKWRVTE